MADRIKGLTIVLSADSSDLVKAISSVNTAIKATQANLRDINRALKFDPKNTELLKDKQNELTKAVEETKAKLEAEKQALQAMKDAGVDETKQQFQDLKTQIDLDESALKGFENQLKNFGSVSSQVMQAVGREIKAVGDKMQEIGGKVADIGGNLTTKVTVPIVAAGTAMVSKYAEVDKTMALANKTMNNTADQAELLNSAMESAAKNSTFGMNDAANAALNFARAGLTAEQAAAAIAPAMNLAAGEAGDLNTVSAGLVGTINGFGDDFNNASHYADVFAAACNNSALDVDTLANSMGVAAPIFNTAGKSVEDAATMLGVMANANIDANTAANSLKTGMARLAEPTKQAKEAMEKYGIAMSDIWNEDGSMKEMTVIQENLNKSFSQLSEQEQMAAAGAIFGKTQMSAWLAVINTAPEKVQKLSTSIRESKGVTDEMSTAMMEGFGGSIEKLKSSLDVLMTSLGRIIAEYLTPVIAKIQSVVDAFSSLDKETQQHIIQIAGIVAAVGPLLLVIGKVITAIGSVISAVGTITTAVGAILPVLSGAATLITGTVIPAIAAIGAPVLVVVGVITALIAIIVQCIKHWDDIKAAASKAVEQMSAAWTNFKNTLANLWNNIKNNTAQTVNNMIQRWQSFKNSVISVWNNIKSSISSIASGIFSTVSNNFNNIRNAVSSKVNEARNNAVNAFNNMRSGIANSVGNIRSVIENGFSSAVGYVRSLAGDAWSWGYDIIDGIIDGIRSAIGRLASVMSDIASTIRSYIHFSLPDKGPLKDFNTYMPDMTNQLVKGIRSGIPQIENAMNSLAQSMVPGMGGLAAESAGTTNNSTSNNVSINVYGAQGQNINELADLIEQKITNNVVRRGVAF